MSTEAQQRAADAVRPRPELTARRVLVTGAATYWGGRLAQALEAFPEVEAIIAVDSADPTREFERAEYVRVSNQHTLIKKIVQAATIDTVIDTRLVVDSAAAAPREAHENNVMGTLNILAACEGEGSPVSKFIFKSSAHYYGCEQDDPAFFTESQRRPHPPQTPIERDIVDAETAVAEFAERETGVTVSVLRCVNVLGPEITTSHARMFALPVVPMVLGFDPRYQFVHSDDVVHALEHAVLHNVPGVFNVAADGVLALSEVIDLLGKRSAPILPPWGTNLISIPLRRAGLRIPNEMLAQMKFGRALDNSKLKSTGFGYRFTTVEAVQAFGDHLRLNPVLKRSQGEYTYEREVEEFLRWSPNVRRASGKGASDSDEPFGI